jgi:hypothetical protein
MKMENIQILPFPKKKQIENTNTQYISKTSQYVKPFYGRKPLNNDIEFLNIYLI